MKTDPLWAGGIELTFHMPNSSKDIAQNDLKHTGDTRRVMKRVHPDIEVKVGWRTLKVRRFKF